MEFDHIVIGSGLSALASVIGLPKNARVLVLTGGADEHLSYYNHGIGVPSSFVGFGGLGRYWHGVIPMGLRSNFAGASHQDFVDFFSYFYPRTEVATRVGEPWLFVPRQAIRPRRLWKRLLEERGDRLLLSEIRATKLEIGIHQAKVITHQETYAGRRIWLAAGSLHTPGLLVTSFGRDLARGYADDHVIIYLGLLDQKAIAKSVVSRPRYDWHGMWLPSCYSATPEALLTQRPARFDFSKLDFGIERRAVFGLPTGSVISRLVKAPSLGLLSEALFNKFGLFPNARFQSVYAQFQVQDAHHFDTISGRVTPRIDAIVDTANELRLNMKLEGMISSARPDLFIPAIHLHNTTERHALKSAHINEPDSRILIADASALTNVGPDHHTFKMMLAGFLRARLIAN